jgi:hypothetical protein
MVGGATAGTLAAGTAGTAGTATAGVTGVAAGTTAGLDTGNGLLTGGAAWTFKEAQIDIKSTVVVILVLIRIHILLLWTYDSRNFCSLRLSLFQYFPPP